MPNVPVRAAAEGLPTLRNILDRYEAAAKEDDILWNAASDAEERVVKTDSVRVQVGRRYQWKDDEGNDVWLPIYAYDDSGIEKYFETNLNAQLSIFCGGRNGPEKEATFRAAHEARLKAKKDELARLDACRKKAEDDAGLTVALQKAGASSDGVRLIINEIISFAPTCFDEAVLIARFVTDAIMNDTSYIEDEDALKALTAIAKAGEVRS